MSDDQDTPSIIDREITRFRGGKTLRYSDLTGSEKRDYLFEAGIRATAYTTNPGEHLPDVNHGLLQFAESAGYSFAHHLLSETITHSSDELEPPKRKLFHTFGTTAKIVFRPVPSTPYTGIFCEEAHGLARFSYAGPVLGIGIVPGLGLKFPVAGDNRSENVAVMRTLDPQSQHSVFQHAFTNILPAPRLTNLTMQEVKHRFETVVVDGQGLHQPVQNLARVYTTGLPAEGEIRAPYRLILVPTEETRQASDPQLDFRDDLARNLANGTTIYEVLALDEAEEAALHGLGVETLEDLIPPAQRIGTVTTESEFIASKYGDFRLFFQHSDVFLRKEFE
ncbi:MAG TPA: hypothetical protein DEV93_03075 [Chloroflexi bacterium]|jgi:hypothetical protein|nr:hypothetical protein [Chloroflexota bacterium]